MHYMQYDNTGTLVLTQGHGPGLQHKPQSGHEPDVFPPLPVAMPTCFSRADIEKRWPTIRSIIDEVASYRSYPNAPVGILVSRYLLSGLPYNKADSKVLVLLLPDMYTPVLQEIAAQRPVLVNRPSLDYLHLDVAYEWCTVINGKEHVLMVPISVMNAFALDSKGATGQAVTWWPFVFVAGDAVICGGMSVDVGEMGNMHASEFASTNYRPSRIFSDAILEGQRKIAAAVGSPIPWVNGYWTDADGVTLVMATVYYSK